MSPAFENAFLFCSYVTTHNLRGIMLFFPLQTPNMVVARFVSAYYVTLLHLKDGCSGYFLRVPASACFCKYYNFTSIIMPQPLRLILAKHTLLPPSTRFFLPVFAEIIGHYKEVCQQRAPNAHLEVHHWLMHSFWVRGRSSPQR